MIKNTASQKVGAQMVSATDGSAFTSAVTVSVTVDAGVQATGSVGSGACTHEGNGYHTYAPAQAETNGDLLAFTFTGTGAIPATVQVYTIAGDAFTRLGAPAGASVSADILAIDNFVDDLESRLGTPVGATFSADIAAIKTDTAAILVDTGTTLDGKIDTIDTNVDSILVDTTEIGVAGAGLTNINLPNQTMDIVGNITGNISGSVGSVTGAVGSVTGNVGGNVTGTVGTVNALAANVITAAATAADFGTEIAAAVLAAAAAAPIDANVQEINDVILTGDGSATPWGPV